MKPCRYERLIAGRTYVIDVTLVSTGRWRAELARLPTAPGARTALFVPELDRLFLAVRATGDEAAAVWVFRPR